MGRENKKNTRWAVLYGKFKLHLVETGQATSIDDNQPLGALTYAKKLRATMATLGLWKENCNLSQPERVELVRRSLYLVCRMQYCQDVFDFEGSLSRAMTKVQNAVTCILHLHKHIMERSCRLFTRFVSMNTRKTKRAAFGICKKDV
jgi:hypothetical protein